MKRECYAKILGGCNSLTKEHYFSKAILMEFFSPEFQVSGFKFSKASPASFCSHILCGNHNSKLEKYDKAALNLFRLLRRVSLNQELGKMHIINGLFLEKWILKVFLGLCHAEKINLNLRAEAQEKFIKILFDKELWASGSGLYSVFPSIGSEFEIDCSLGGKILENAFIVRMCNLNFAIKFSNFEIASSDHWNYHPYGGIFDQGSGHKVNLKFLWRAEN